MIKYYKNTDGVVHKLVPDANNTIEQILSYNPDLIEEVTEADYEAQELPRLKRIKKVHINQRTNDLIAQGIDHNGVHFDMKAEDQANINTLFNLMNNGVSMAGQYFRASGQDYTFVDNADFLGLVQTAMTIVQGHVQSGAALKNQVDTATTIADVNMILDNR